MGFPHVRQIARLDLPNGLQGNPKGIAIIQPSVDAQRLRWVNTQKHINPEWVESRRSKCFSHMSSNSPVWIKSFPKKWWRDRPGRPVRRRSGQFPGTTRRGRQVPLTTNQCW
jgi:hypothetical protein